jgi:hypothetical protein
MGVDGDASLSPKEFVGENEWRRDVVVNRKVKKRLKVKVKKVTAKAEAKVWVNFACILLFESQSTIDGFPGPASSCVVDDT